MNIKRQTKHIDPDIEKKIDELLVKMTLEEKIGQMTQHGTSIYYESLDICEDMIREGKIGSFLTLRGAEKINKLQKIAVEESRLGIPLVFGDDVIHGYKTIFPIPLATACSWDMEKIKQSAEIAAREASAAGLKWTFAPMVDIARDPRWGRIAEGAGEDPHLGSEIAAAWVQGFQGDDYSNPESVVACVKHFAAYGAAIGGRDYNTVDMSLQMLHEVYLPPFKAAVAAGVGTVMTAFNDLNGVPCTGSKYLLEEVLRKQFEFKGFVVSDANSVFEMVPHGFAEDRKEAACKGVQAGLDMDMASVCYENELEKLVSEGKIDGDLLNESVRRILRIKYAAGLFENPYTDASREQTDILSDENINAAREIARSSIVLLKNDDDLLPIKKDTKKIAIVGPLADDTLNPLGTWACSGSSENVVSLLAGIKNAVAKEAEILYAPGCDIEGDSTDGFEEALQLAQKADVIIAAVGEGKTLSGEAKSRSNLKLPGKQEELLKILYNTGKPLVVVLMNGRPLVMPWALDKKVPAILEAWHLGIQSGNAIADVIFGDYNPGGKLVTSFPHSEGQLPVYYNHPSTGKPASEENRFTTKYIDVPVKPLYSFGYGLSYTKFEYTDLNIIPKEVKTGGKVAIEAEIRNVGKVKGEEIVQLYVSDLCASRVRPVKELKGFKKIMLEPGEAQKVTFELETSALGFWDENMKYIIEQGRFKVLVAPNSEEGLEDEFTIV